METESQAMVSGLIWVLGTELESSARAVPAPNCILFLNNLFVFMYIGILPARMSIRRCQIPLEWRVMSHRVGAGT